MTGLEVAKNYLGLQEVDDKKELMELFYDEAVNDDLCIDPSKTAWCAAFMNATQRKAGLPGNGHLNALSFLTYGTEVVNWDDAEEGDIVVFDRGNGLGHVAYFIEWLDSIDAVKVLGGNQSDEVCYENHTQDNIIMIRRPPKNA